jgi:hypothetical protein
MKKRAFLFSVLICLCLMTVNISINESKKFSVVMNNIEALANDENCRAKCVGLGSLDCPYSKDKVLYML